MSWADKRVARAEQQGQGSPGGNLARQFAQGLTFDFADEMEAGVRAPFSDRSYGDIRDQIRENNDTFFEENPVKSVAAQGAAGFVPVLGWANKAGKLGKLADKFADGIPSWLSGHFGKGVAEGTASGLGTTEDITDLSQVAKDTGVGSGIGGGLGFGVGVAGKTIGKYANEPKDKVGRFVKKVMGSETPESLADVAKRNGPGAVLGDANPEMRGATQYVSTMPGARNDMNKFLDERQFEQPDRLNKITTDATGETGDVAGRRAQMNTERQAKADSLYQEGIHKEFINPTSDMMEYVAEDGKAFAKKALKAIKTDPQNQIPDDQIINSVKFWDLMTREMKKSTTNAVGKAKGGAMDIPVNNRIRSIVSDIDGQIDGRLSNARSEYSQLKKNFEAVDTGKKFMKMDADEFIREVGKMTPEEKQSTLVGFTNAIINKIDRAPETANNAWNAVKSGAFKRKIRALVGNEKADSYIDQMMGQMEQTLTRNASNPNTNSITSAVRAFDDSFGGDMAGMAADAAQGNVGSLANAARGMFGKTGPNEEQLKKLGTLMRLPPDQVQAGLEAVLEKGKIAPYILPAIRSASNAGIPELLRER